MAVELRRRLGHDPGGVKPRDPSLDATVAAGASGSKRESAEATSSTAETQVGEPTQETLVADATQDTQVGDPTGPAGDGEVVHLERGDSIGRYLVLDELGAGGMGVVYAAYDGELDRKLAIKLLRPAAQGTKSATDGTSRLVREAQAMAKLNHPNVVTVHDVGTHKGAVFVAMEFVDGESLGDWMERGRHPWREVLVRFLAAGRGLAAAHAAGLVHRDFKPDNVLLGGAGKVRVADFGLARPESAGSHVSVTETLPADLDLSASTSGSGALSSKLTATGALMGTPAYMAPEQHTAIGVDARADQFAFSVALFEALYGIRPFAGDTLPVLAFQVCSGEIREPPKDADVPGWIKKIVLRGLSRDPNARFPSMNDMLEALGNDPALRRRRWLAGAAAVVVIGSAATAMVIAGGERQALCTGFEDSVANVWSEAEREAVGEAFAATGLAYGEDTAKRTVARLDDWSAQWAEQAKASCEATHVRGEQSEKLLDLRTACLHRARRDVGAVVAVLREADDKTVKRAVDAVRSVTDLDECADTERLLAVVPPPDDPKVAAGVEELRGQIARSAALLAAGNYKESLAEAKAAQEASAGIDYLPLQTEAHFQVAAAATKLDDADLTKSAVEDAVCTGLASGEDRYAARASYHMLWAVSPEGADPEELEHWLGLSRALVERVGDDTLQIDLWSNEANALRRLGKLEEAMATIDKALALAIERFGEESVQSAHLRMNVAAIAWAKGDFGLAAEVSRKAYPIWQRELGNDHPRTATALNNLALAAVREGNYAEAEETMRKVIVTRERVYGKKSKEYADALSNLAVVLTSSGGLDEAIEINRELADTYTEVSGADSVDVAQIWANLAAVLHEAGREEEALGAIQKGIELLEAKLGKEHRFMPTAYAILGGIERELGDLDASSRHLAHGLAVGEKALGPDSPRHATILSEIALTEVLRKRPKAALEAVERALRVAGDQPLEPKHLGDLYFAEAQALWETGGDRKRAVARAREALGHLEDGGETTRREADRVKAWLASHSQAD